MLAAEFVRSLFTYSKRSGVLIWRERPSIGYGWNTRYAGKPAGTINGSGYVSVCVFGRLYHAHQLIWLWVTGTWPPDELDHRDTNRANNRWRNLRVATPSQNKMNGSIRSDNTSGHRGVYWDASRQRWHARIGAGRRCHHLGYFRTAEKAAAAYRAAAKQHHGAFARY